MRSHGEDIKTMELGNNTKTMTLVLRVFFFVCWLVHNNLVAFYRLLLKNLYSII